MPPTVPGSYTLITIKLTIIVSDAKSGKAKIKLNFAIVTREPSTGPLRPGSWFGFIILRPSESVFYVHAQALVVQGACGSRALSEATKQR